MTRRRQRAVDLLVDHTTEGLTPELEAELAGLLALFPDLDPEPFELAAAAIELACGAPTEPMPADLCRRLRRRVGELDQRRHLRPVPSPPGARP